MTPAKYAKILESEGAHVVRINKKTVSVSVAGKTRLVPVPSYETASNWFNWFFTLVILACTLFIGLQLKKHTERVERLENQLLYEIYIHQIARNAK